MFFLKDNASCLFLFIYLLSQAYPCNKMNVAGFPFRVQILDNFLKGASRK